MPDEMREQLQSLAMASGRSLNAEIVYRLQRSIEDDQVETGGIRHMEFRIVDPSIGKGPQKIFNALDEMEKILLDAKRMLEEDESTDGGETNNG